MPYHHGNLREALVAAGVEAAAAGPEAVALREVARAVGVSHNAAYRHFADREELLQAVAARAITTFAEVMADRIATAAKGRSREAAWSRLAASGRAYVEFATTYPGLFRTVMRFPMGSVGPDADVDHPYTQLSQRLDELVATGATTARRRANAEVVALAAVHGYASLVLDGPWRGQEPLGDLEDVLRIFRDGL